MNGLRLCARYLAISVRSQMQYRASWMLGALGHFATSATEIVGIWALFSRFHALGNWRLPEVALLYGLVHTAFAVAEGGVRGFDVFPAMIRSGDFDRVLLRPRSAALQVAARELQLMRLGRLSQGVVILVWAWITLGLGLTWGHLALCAGAILGAAALFAGLFIITATASFWSTESLELVNVLTYGGTEAGQFPLDIYRPWFRNLFIFVVPLACVTYFPALALLGRTDPLLGAPAWFLRAAPVLGFVFLVLSLQLWRVGVRHYRSTGS